MPGGIPTLKIFVSSPGDVTRERRKTEEVIERLNGEFRAKIRLIPYFWEYEPLNIAKDYQEQIPPPSGFDIFICILWTRLGARLQSRYMLPPDYTRVARSGTEYEFQDAWLNYVKMGVPEMLVLVNKSVPDVSLEAPDIVERQLQYDELKAFIGEWTQDKREDVRKGAVNSYRTLVEFEDLLEKKLRKIVQNRLGGDRT